MSKIKKQKNPEPAIKPAPTNPAPTPNEFSEEQANPPQHPLSNYQALAAIETERDELLLSLMLSFNTEGFNRMIVTALESDHSPHSPRSLTSEYDQVTIEMTLPSLADLQPISQLTYNPYQISRVQIDPSLKNLAAEELSLQILNAFQQAATDGLLRWLRFCLLAKDTWDEICKKEAQAIIAQSNRVQFDKPHQSLESLAPNSEKRLQSILRTLETHGTVLSGEFAAVWQKGLNRFIREHPQLVSQAEKRNLEKLIQSLGAIKD